MEEKEKEAKRDILFYLFIYYKMFEFSQGDYDNGGEAAKGEEADGRNLPRAEEGDPTVSSKCFHGLHG